MKVLCTYCSAEKQTVVGNVPAISRYISKRIDRVAKQAEKENRPLFILSGKYGIIPAAHPIPYYDHLLTQEEVLAHAKKVASQIKEGADHQQMAQNAKSTRAATAGASERAMGCQKKGTSSEENIVPKTPCRNKAVQGPSLRTKRVASA